MTQLKGFSWGGLQQARSETTIHWALFTGLCTVPGPTSCPIIKFNRSRHIYIYIMVRGPIWKRTSHKVSNLANGLRKRLAFRPVGWIWASVLGPITKRTGLGQSLGQRSIRCHRNQYKWLGRGLGLIQALN